MRKNTWFVTNQVQRGHLHLGMRDEEGTRTFYIGHILNVNWETAMDIRSELEVRGIDSNQAKVVHAVIAKHVLHPKPHTLE